MTPQDRIGQLRRQVATAYRLSTFLASPTDRGRLLAFAGELEEKARKLEIEEAKHERTKPAR